MEPTQLDERLASIEARLSKLEGSPKPATPAAKPAMDEWARSAPGFAAIPASPASPASPAAPTAASAPAAGRVYRPRSTPAVEESKPGNWLGIIAIICFILAAGFIIKLSIDTGWLTPTRQLGIAVLLGFGLIGTGLMLMDSDRAYASLLPGGGVIVLYLTAFAAHRYYGLISFPEALALTGLVSVFCIWLYREIGHDVYAIAAATGAYLSPVILGMHAETAFALYYFLLCSLAFATISIWVQSRTLTFVSAYLAILMTGLVGMDIGLDTLVTIMLALQFLVFSVGSFLYTTQSQTPLTEPESWFFMPVLLIFYAMEYYFIDRIQPGLAPWVSLGFAAVLIGLYLAAKNYFSKDLGSRSLIIVFVTIVCFHSIYLELLPADIKPWLFVLGMLAFAFIPTRFASAERDIAYSFPVLAVGAILVIEYISMLHYLMDDGGTQWLLVSGASFASIWYVQIGAEAKLVERPTFGHALLMAAHLLAVLGLYRLTENIGSLAVSASWLLYAVIVLMIGVSRKDNVMAKSALLILAFAAAKALLYDAASAPTIVRIMCLLLTGTVLYGSGFLMRKFADWTKG